MADTAVGGNNAGLNALAPTFARSIFVKLIGRPYVYVFHKDCRIFPNIDLNIKLMPSSNNFVCKFAAFGWNLSIENYKMFIKSLNLIIRTKVLTSIVYDALLQLLL